MKIRNLTCLSLALCWSAAEAAQSQDCCVPATDCCSTPVYSSSSYGCNSCSNGPTTKLFKAKDGTIREVISHWEALHRSVEADHLEVTLKETQGQLSEVTASLEGVRAELVAANEKAAAQVAAFEQQIAELKNQLGEQTKVAAGEKTRAEKAEAAHKQSVAEAGGLREAEKKSQAMLAKVQSDLAKVQGDLQLTSTERDQLKAANDKLQNDVSAAAAEKAKVDEALKNALAEVLKMKQEAAESKKVAVVEEKKDANAEPAKEEAPKADEPKSDEPKPEALRT